MSRRPKKVSKPVEFVRPKQEVQHALSLPTTSGGTTSVSKASREDGSTIRNFYESLVLTDTETVASKKTQQTRKRKRCAAELSESRKNDSSKKRTRSMDRVKAEFLRCAQEGIVSGIKMCLNEHVQIDIQDGYGWTALMIASHEGRQNVVQYLLEQGADKNIVDQAGRSAENLARLAKHSHLAGVIREHTPGKQYDGETKGKCESARTPKETFFCATCNMEFSDTKPKEHSSSTVHLFNCKLDPKPTYYHLSEANKGFQMMVRSGWDAEQGLGPEGHGNKFPLKTILKRDRRGLGNKTQDKAKVTHFAPHDTKAVKAPKIENSRKMRMTTLSKKAKKAKLSKEQEWERNFRLQFTME